MVMATDSGIISRVQRYKKILNKFIFDKIWNSKNVFIIRIPVIINIIEDVIIKIIFVG